MPEVSSSEQGHTAPPLFGSSIPIAPRQTEKISVFQQCCSCLCLGTSFSQFDDSVHVQLKKDRKLHPGHSEFVPRTNMNRETVSNPVGQ